jgi:hypothetical protein
MDARNTGRAVRGVRSVSYELESANDGVEAEAVASHAPSCSSKKGARFAALTLDDFGGRSDALGG